MKIKKLYILSYNIMAKEYAGEQISYNIMAKKYAGEQTIRILLSLAILIFGRSSQPPYLAW